MISSLRKYIKKELFNPSILGIFLNPFYFARKSLYKNIKDLAPNCKGKILDVGCGNKPYKVYRLELFVYFIFYGTCQYLWNYFWKNTPPK